MARLVLGGVTQKSTPCTVLFTFVHLQNYFFNFYIGVSFVSLRYKMTANVLSQLLHIILFDIFELHTGTHLITKVKQH
jgi:hypothetical protein